MGIGILNQAQLVRIAQVQIGIALQHQTILNQAQPQSCQVTLEGFGLGGGCGAASASAPLREARSSRAVFASTRVVALLLAIVDQY